VTTEHRAAPTCRRSGRHTAQADRQRRPFGTHSHLQLSAGPRHRSPYQPDAVQTGQHHRGRPEAGGRCPDERTPGRPAGRTGRRLSHSVTTIDQAIRQATRQLQPASESAALDARLLLAHVLGVSTTALYRDARKVLTPALLEQFDTCIERRAAGEPIAYITGHCGFWTLDLMVNA